MGFKPERMATNFILFVAFMLAGDAYAQDIEKAFAAQARPASQAAGVDPKVHERVGNARAAVQDQAQKRENRRAAEFRAATASGPAPSAGPYRCEIQCRGPLFATGSRLVLDSLGPDADSARGAVQRRADTLCMSERNMTWGEVLRCKTANER